MHDLTDLPLVKKINLCNECVCVCLCVYMCVYVCICVYMCVYVCMCVYVKHHKT
jgi:hypothetical protein